MSCLEWAPYTYSKAVLLLLRQMTIILGLIFIHTTHRRPAMVFAAEGFFEMSLGGKYEFKAYRFYNQLYFERFNSTSHEYFERFNYYSKITYTFQKPRSLLPCYLKNGHPWGHFLSASGYRRGARPPKAVFRKSWQLKKGPPRSGEKSIAGRSETDGAECAQSFFLSTRGVC